MVKLSILSSSILLLLGCASALPTFSDLQQLAADELAPLYHSPEAEAISDSYIVVLKDHVDANQVQSHCHWVRSLHKREALADFLDADMAAGIRYTYDIPGLKGYSGKFSQDVLHRIRSSPEVLLCNG